MFLDSHTDFEPASGTIFAEYGSCNAGILAAYSGKLPFYETYDAALDLEAAISAVDPSDLGFYALSYCGTYFSSTYL